MSLEPTLSLQDVSYILQARFELTGAAGASDSPAQHAAMFKRRARGQRFYRAPYLGRRDLPANVSLLGAEQHPTSEYAGEGTIDLGWMIYDRDRADHLVTRFYRPTMVDGVIDLAEVVPDLLPS